MLGLSSVGELDVPVVHKCCKEVRSLITNEAVPRSRTPVVRLQAVDMMLTTRLPHVSLFPHMDHKANAVLKVGLKGSSTSFAPCITPFLLGRRLTRIHGALCHHSRIIMVQLRNSDALHLARSIAYQPLLKMA